MRPGAERTGRTKIYLEVPPLMSTIPDAGLAEVSPAEPSEGRGTSLEGQVPA